MTTQKNVVDLVADKVIEDFHTQIEPRIAEVIEDARAAVDQRVTDFLVSVPITAAPPVDHKTDAKDRAQRTVIQGLVSTVVVAVLLAITGVIGGDGFDIASASDWKAVGGAALGALLTAGVAFVHRLVTPPKGEG